MAKIINSAQFEALRTVPDLSTLLLRSCTYEQAHLMDQATLELTEIIKGAAQDSIPYLKPTSRSKPWWNDSLKSQRRKMAREQRTLYSGMRTQPPDTQELARLHRTYREARNEYNNAIKKAKADHWNSFLESGTPDSIYKAFGYTKDSKGEKIPSIKSNQGTLQDTFSGKYSAFRKILFPIPPEVVEPD